MDQSKYKLSSQELDFLGLRLSARPQESRVSDDHLDLERVLFKVCLHLQEDRFDGRLVSALASWMKVHGDRVHVDRLRNMRLDHCNKCHRDVLWLRFLAYYNCSLGRHNWKKLTQAVAGANAEVLYLGDDPEASKALLDRWGLEPFLPTNGKLKVHRGALRIRESDVLDQQALMVRNVQYRNRFRFGANARCDVVTHMESGKFSTVKELSQFLRLSQEAVRRNWEDNKRFWEVCDGISAP